MWKKILNFLKECRDHMERMYYAPYPSPPRVLFSNGYVEVSCFYCGKPISKGGLYDVVVITTTQEVHIVHRECANERGL